MATTVTAPAFLFPQDYDPQSEFETPSRGYLGDVTVQFSEGTCYRLYFIDAARLQQNLNDEVALGRPYFAEPNMVVLPEVTTQAVRDAVRKLWIGGFFERLLPCNGR